MHMRQLPLVLTLVAATAGSCAALSSSAAPGAFAGALAKASSAPVAEMPAVDAAHPAKELAKLSGGAEAPAALIQNLKVMFYIGAWYYLNVQYNIQNKKTLTKISFPWILSVVQLGVGTLYVSLIWLLRIRKAPICNSDHLKAIAPLALMHTFSHIGAVIALGAGAVGFVHIVKAAEPLFTALFSGIFLGQVFALPVYASLIPVVVGVAVASLKELSFSWTSFGGAMTSNVAAASRGVFAKASMGKPKGENMDAGNLYGVMTIMATLILLPFSLLIEGRKVGGLWNTALKAGHSKRDIIQGSVLSGVFFYMYNEVAFYCLNAIHPVTHAVANTIKRVVLLAVSVVVFHQEVTATGLAGSGVAVAGVLLYSLVKDYYAKKAVEAPTKK